MAWQDGPPEDGQAPQRRGRAPRVFKHEDAAREQQRAFISLTGASGGGKTKSALELAQGLVSVTGPIDGRSLVFVVDSENKRAKKYAPPRLADGSIGPASPIDAAPEGKTYAFEHVEFEPPFDPDSYLDALHYCEAQGAGAVIFDSMSHEHAGEGGRLDSHGKIAGDNPKANFSAWRPNSDARNRLLWGGFFRSPCHIILCFRAKDKSEQRGTKIIDSGFTPIGGADFIFEADCSLLFMPQASGVPTWQSDLRGEQSAIKLPDEYRRIFRPGEPVTWRQGAAIARWLNAAPTPAKTTERIGESAPISISHGGGVPARIISRDADEPVRVTYAGAVYDPATPLELESEVPLGMMSPNERMVWASALAELMKASSPERRVDWLDLNEKRVAALSENAQTRLREIAGAPAPA